MKFKLFFVSFTLFFFNSANAICIPRNRSAPSPTPLTPSNLRPVLSSPSTSPRTPVSSLPSSLPKVPLPTSPAPTSSSPKNSKPSSPAPTARGPNTNPSIIKNPINTITSALPKPGGGGNNPGLKKICDATDYPDVCLGTLGPIAGPATDAASVLGVAIKAGSDTAKKALDTAQQLATKTGTPPDEASSIKDCKDSFDDVSYNFQNAADAFTVKDIGTLNTMLSAAITDVEDCKDAFQGRESPLTSISDTLRKMASNCLAIVDVMNKQP